MYKSSSAKNYGWVPQVGHKGAKEHKVNMKTLHNFLVLTGGIDSNFWSTSLKKRETVQPWQKRPTVSAVMPSTVQQHLGLNNATY